MSDCSWSQVSSKFCRLASSLTASPIVITGNPFSFREEAIVDFPAPGIPVRQIIILICFFISNLLFPILLFCSLSCILCTSFRKTVYTLYFMLVISKIMKTKTIDEELSKILYMHMQHHLYL